MKIKLLRKKPEKYLLILSSLILLSAMPFFAGSGLDTPQPLSIYLNENFPAVMPEGLPYEPVFPNITFDSPLTFNEVPNGDKIIVGQRDGQLFWFDKISNASTKNVLIDLSEKVGVVWDGGFLGLTLHPEFGTADNNYIYVYYTTEDANSNDFPNMYTTQSCDSEEYWGNFLVLARYTVNPTTLNVQASSEQVMLKLRMYGTTHRGGGLLFGDDDFLYLTTGDQTAFKKSQDILNNLDGGVLRMDVDKDPSKSHAPVRNMPDDHGFSDEITGNGYWIPNDNPFLSPTGISFEEYYSMGHRNPHRMTKDRETGLLYIGEIGGGRHEEINVVKKGGNFGWPLFEGLYRSTFCVENLYNDMLHEEPLLAFPRAEANAVIGGYVYRGTEIPELQGKYICADYGRGEEIWTVDINTGAYTQLGNFSSTNIISFGEDKQGEIYILKQGVSSLYKMVSKDNPTTIMPNLLSETGAFKNLNTLEPIDGLIPYDLVESFWSDSALKKRWIGIPNDGTHDTSGERIAYSENDVWNFPIGSVLVKHFELPIDERNPTITKRLETRFSIKGADGNFYFVTYKWNSQGTDAVLLTSGLDETITIQNADGSSGTQTWTYPSTSDCISCHNPATGGTLGTRTRYLNKDFTYPATGRTANQLVTFSSLGILDANISDANTSSLLTSKAMDDPNATLDEKARSYLDLNCANCHRPGTGNRGNFDLRLKLNLVETGLLMASPYESLGIPNEKIVDPGKPETSILYHRTNSVDPTIMMPPIAKNKVDAKAVQLINDWISQLTPEDNPCANRIIMETFDNVPGYTLDELRNNTNFPDNPTRVTELVQFSIPYNVADNYGARVKAILKAPETGTFYFWVEGDDNVALSLSTDDSELNKTRIAYHDGWTFPEEWNKFPTQKSAGINLVAGQNYYIEALMNERTGGDNLSVGWRKPSDGNGAVPVEILPCDVFDYFDGPPVVNVSGVRLDVQSIALEVGDTRTLIATISPDSANDQVLTWASSNPSIATVNSNGLVTAVAEGNTTITATTNDGGFTASAAVTIEPIVVGVTDVLLVPETPTIVVGSTQVLTATLLPSNASDRSVTWASNNLAVATVNSNGRVTAVAAGNATITVTTNDGGFTALSNIEIISDTTNDCTSSGSILMERYDNIPGHKIADLLNATIYPEAPSSISELSRLEIAQNTGDDYGVRVRGYLCAPETGTYYFYVSGNNYSELSLSTTSEDSDKVRIAYHENWTSNKEWTKYASQKSQGIVLDKGNTYYIEALMKEGSFGDHLAAGWRKPSDGNGANASEVVPGNVLSPIVLENVAVDGVSLSPTNLTLTIYESATLNVSISPFNASDKSVVWSSSNDAIATVDSNGVVMGLTEGTVNVMVSTNDGGFISQANIEVITNGPSSCTASGTILMERYEDIAGNTIADLLNAPNYPSNPSSVAELTKFQTAKNTGNNYGVRVRGYLCAPETGTYYFFVSGNNYSELSLSSTSEESDKVRIAYHEDWTSNMEWNKFTTQKSQSIFLRKGDTYYIEGLMKEGSFGDHLAAGWRKPSDGNGTEASEVIPGNVFSPFMTTEELGQFLIWELDTSATAGPNFMFSPNPASTQLSISVSNVDEGTAIDYAIYSVSGSEVLRLKGGPIQTIDIANLAKGAYILIVSTDVWTKSENLLVR